MKYVAKHYVRVAKVLITPGEVFEANLTQAQEERLIAKDAIEKVTEERARTETPSVNYVDSHLEEGALRGFYQSKNDAQTETLKPAAESESELYGELPRTETPGSESELKEEEPEAEPEPMEIDVSEGFVPAKKSRKKKG